MVAAVPLKLAPSLEITGTPEVTVLVRLSYLFALHVLDVVIARLPTRLTMIPTLLARLFATRLVSRAVPLPSASYRLPSALSRASTEPKQWLFLLVVETSVPDSKLQAIATPRILLVAPLAQLVRTLQMLTLVQVNRPTLVSAVPFVPRTRRRPRVTWSNLLPLLLAVEIVLFNVRTASWESLVLTLAETSNLPVPIRLVALNGAPVVLRPTLLKRVMVLVLSFSTPASVARHRLSRVPHRILADMIRPLVVTTPFEIVSNRPVVTSFPAIVDRSLLNTLSLVLAPARLLKSFPVLLVPDVNLLRLPLVLCRWSPKALNLVPAPQIVAWQVDVRASVSLHPLAVRNSTSPRVPTVLARVVTRPCSMVVIEDVCRLVEAPLLTDVAADPSLVVHLPRWVTTPRTRRWHLPLFLMSTPGLTLAPVTAYSSIAPPLDCLWRCRVLGPCCPSLVHTLHNLIHGLLGMNVFDVYLRLARGCKIEIMPRQVALYGVPCAPRVAAWPSPYSVVRVVCNRGNVAAL